jgi:crotonobetaine/carnitine-CoA ligase
MRASSAMRHADVLTVVGHRTVADVLRAGAGRTPDRTLLVFDDLDGGVQEFTWEDVLERSTTVAAALAGAGVFPGDHVHLHLPNRPEFIFHWFGCALRGAVMVPTNVASSVAELEYILGHVGAVLSVTDGAGFDTVRDARAAAGLAGDVWRCDAASASSAKSAGLAPPPDGSAAPSDVGPLSDLAVMYTSGTTSRPKGVRVTHANYVFAGESVAAGLGLVPGDRFLVVLPLFHANAQYYSVMSALVTGATVVLASRFSASGWVDTAIRHEATVASLFAAPIRMILAKESSPHWRSHRLRVVAFAQNLTTAEYAAWGRDIGAPLLQLYGMTETIGPPLMNPLHGGRRHDSLGRVVLGYRCRITDRDGAPVRPGDIGELRVAGVPGVSLMAGYLKDPDATEEVMGDGWLKTGDLVREDPDGLISFVTRVKDMIKRAGENIAAGEIEDVLMDHPSVMDAAVVGVPDAMRDETIVAFVVTADGDIDDEALRTWCADRLARFRVPEFFAGRTVLPRTSVGKIQKQALREEWSARR